MGNFFTSLFSSKKEYSEEGKAKNNKKNFDIFKFDGVRAQKIGQLDYAIKCYKEAIRLNEDFETMNYLVSAYTQQGELEEALDVIDRMIDLEPNHVEILIMRANLCYMLDRHSEVLVDCEDIISRNAQHHPAHFLLGKSKKATQDLLGAIAAFTKAIALKEDFAEGYLPRAEVLHTMHQENEALVDVEKVLSLSPQEESAFLLRGEIKEALGEKQAAETDYQQVIELNPFNEKAWLLLGQLYIQQEKLDKAIEFFDEAIELKSNFAKAYSERGRARFLKGDKTAAAEDMKKAIELNPEGEEAKKFEGENKNFDDLYKGGIF